VGNKKEREVNCLLAWHQSPFPTRSQICCPVQRE
jgi:hypothetical protein